MKIFFATSNKSKVKEFKSILEPGIEVEQITIEYPELRSDYPEEIAGLAAKQLADKLQRPIVVEDSGLFISALNGFPGTCSAYIHKRIGLEGILKLMQDVKNREAKYVSAVGYCEPGKKARVFLGSEKGRIARKILGESGFGHDPIFIPEGESKTYGQMENYDKMKKFRKEAVLKLAEFLRNEKE
jgi:XTP/dITP diphosphohydrolase